MRDLADFMHWGSRYRDFPYGEFSYWMTAFRRNDGKDMYGQPLRTESDRDQTPAHAAQPALPAARPPQGKEAG